MHQTSAGEVHGPYVPRGTVFVVELVDELARDGGAWRARLEQALHAPDASVVVRSGAMLRGRIVRRDEAPDDLVHVELLTIQTVAGDVPVSVARADPATAPTTSRVLESRPAPAGTKLTLVLTEPLVPVGSTYR